jgi:EAL and modified HD-GYP domain-containing signal transduction protein
MYGFIARQPIFNPEMNTVAYELLFRDGMTNRFPDVSAEYATSRMISDQFLCVPSQRIAGAHTSFINFPQGWSLTAAEKRWIKRAWSLRSLKMLCRG